MSNTQDETTRNYYSKAQFWDERYVEKEGFFDWYAEYPELKYTFEEQYGMTKDDSILMVGCGNSKLSQQMHQVGYKNIVNIDISPVVIKQMKQHSPEMEWLVMDATEMTFQDNRFDYVIDKGTMDALIAGRDLTPTIKLLKQSMRVTKEEGQVILITYGSPQGRKKIYQSSLPFNLFDYYFSYVNLSDLSTMINLMRNNIIGPNGEKLQKQFALQKSMKEFMMIKILRQKHSKQKQFVIWENFNNKVQKTPPPTTQESETKQQKQQLQKQEEVKQQTNLNDQAQGTDIQESNKKVQESSQNQTKIKYLSKPQKQSYVYAYSIKRKFGYDFFAENVQVKDTQFNYKGEEGRAQFQLKGSSQLSSSIAKCVNYCTSKTISYSSINYIDQNQQFTKNEDSVKVQVQEGDGLKLNVISKTNIDLKVKYSNLTQALKVVQKLGSYLVEKLQLNLHPCPKTFSLFTLLKGKLKLKTVNELLIKYWYPTYKIQQVNAADETILLTLSVPPVLLSTLEKIKQQIVSFLSKQKIHSEIHSTRNGFITFPELKLFSVLNIVSLSQNNGKPIDICLKDFWKGEQTDSEKQQRQSNLFIVNNTRIQASLKLSRFAILYLISLY